MQQPEREEMLTAAHDRALHHVPDEYPSLAAAAMACFTRLDREIIAAIKDAVADPSIARTPLSIAFAADAAVRDRRATRRFARMIR